MTESRSSGLPERGRVATGEGTPTIVPVVEQASGAVIHPPASRADGTELEDRSLQLFKEIRSWSPELAGEYARKFLDSIQIENDLARRRVEHAHELELRRQARLDAEQNAELEFQRSMMKQRWLAIGAGGGTMIIGVGTAFVLALQGGETTAVATILGSITTLSGGLTVAWGRRRDGGHS